MRAGGCPAVVAQWQNTGGSSQVFWVRLPVTAGFFTFFYFHLSVSKFIYCMLVFYCTCVITDTCMYTCIHHSESTCTIDHTNAYIHTTTHPHATHITQTTTHTPPCARRVDTVLFLLQARRGMTGLWTCSSRLGLQ